MTTKGSKLWTACQEIYDYGHNTYLKMKIESKEAA